MAEFKTLKAVKKSNFARGADFKGKSVFDGEDASDPAELGYKVFAYPDAGPVRSNAGVKNTEGRSFGEVIINENDGTSIDAYEHQVEDIDAKKGESK